MNLSYWACVLNPPLFTPLTWWHADLPLDPNDSEWTGGIRIPLLTSTGNYLRSNETLTLYSHNPPICIQFNNTSNSPCIQLQAQLYLYYQPKKGSTAANLTFITAIATSSETLVNASQVPPIPICQANLYWKYKFYSIQWTACRIPQPRKSSIFNVTLLDWGPYGHLSSNHATI